MCQVFHTFEFNSHSNPGAELFPEEQSEAQDKVQGSVTRWELEFKSKPACTQSLVLSTAPHSLPSKDQWISEVLPSFRMWLTLMELPTPGRHIWLIFFVPHSAPSLPFSVPVEADHDRMRGTHHSGSLAKGFLTVARL